MGSPFPGMNPFLERDTVGHDFHERAIPAIADLVGAQLAPNLVARIDDHIYVHDIGADNRQFIGRADVAVSEFPSSGPGAGGTALLVAPAEVGLPETDEEHLSFVEIRERDSWRVITVIELLSPTNKYQGPNRLQYLSKRSQILNSRAHFVELDLLRGGPRMPLKDLPTCDYYALVSRVERRPKAEVWPFRLRDPLPIIPIPLTPECPDARLDLKAAIDRVYDAARYAHYIYLGQPEPQLSSEETQWAQAMAVRGER